MRIIGTGSAHPSLTVTNQGHQLKAGDRVVLSAFGAGFTTGACLLYW